MKDDDKALLVAAQLEGKAILVNAWHGAGRCFSKWLIRTNTESRFSYWYFIENDRCAIQTLRRGHLYTHRKRHYWTAHPYERKYWKYWNW